MQEAVRIPEEELPLVLPETDNFKPSGMAESPLANITDWMEYTDPQTGLSSLKASYLLNYFKHNLIHELFWTYHKRLAVFLEGITRFLESPPVEIS